VTSKMECAVLMARLSANASNAAIAAAIVADKLTANAAFYADAAREAAEAAAAELQDTAGPVAK